MLIVFLYLVSLGNCGCIEIIPTERPINVSQRACPIMIACTVGEAFFGGIFFQKFNFLCHSLLHRCATKCHQTFFFFNQPTRCFNRGEQCLWGSMISSPPPLASAMLQKGHDPSLASHGHSLNNAISSPNG